MVLTAYFLLTVSFGITEPTLKKYEWTFHALPLGFGSVTSVYGLMHSLYGNAGLWCWITSDHFTYRILFYYGVLWLSALFITMGMFVIYLTSLQLEKEATSTFEVKPTEQASQSSYPSAATAKAAKERTRQVATQALLYGECRNYK